MFYINENIKMNKAYQSLPFLRSTLKSSWWQNRKNGIHSNQQHYSTCWDKFSDAKERVMKYCSSVVIGDSLHTLHVTETLSGNGTRKFSSLFTN
jgi:hypothetical protein